MRFEKMKKVLSITLALVLMLTAIGSTVFAAPYKPSPEQYNTPTVIDDGGLLITPYGQRTTKNTQYPEIKQMLDAAMADIKAASTWETLCSGASAQMETMKAAATDPAAKSCTINDLVLEYLFDASMGDGEKIILPISGSVSFTIATSLKKGDVFVVLHDKDYKDSNWEVLTSYTLADNGDMTITLNGSASPIAIVKYTSTQQNTGKISPKTEGEVVSAPQKREFQVNFGSISGIVMVVFGIALITYAGISAKKKKQ